MTERSERSSGTEQQGGAAEAGRRAAGTSDEVTSLFVADGERDGGKGGVHDATRHGPARQESARPEAARHDGVARQEVAQEQRPNVPLGSPAPPWQRGQQPAGGPPHDGPDRVGPDRVGPDRLGPDRLSSDRPARDHPGHDRPGLDRPGPDRQAGPVHAAEQGPFRPGPALAEHPTIAEPRPPYPPPAPGGQPNGAAGQNPFLSSKEAVVPRPPIPTDRPMPMGRPGAMPVGGPSGPAGPGGHHRPPTGARPTARPSAPMRGRPPRVPRKASLQIRRFDPWSVLKLSLVLSVAMFLIWLVAVGLLYGVLDGMGVWDKLNGAYSDLASVNDETGGGEPLISAGRVFGISAVVGVVNIVLFTAFATVGAFVYNVSADLAGGIEVTLSERD